MSDEIQEALAKIFAADSEIYQNRGFQRRIGYGKRPALINIDLANAWTRPGHAFSCDGMDTIIPGVQALLKAGRAKRIPIVYTTTAYNVTDGSNTDMGLWHLKIPAEILNLDNKEEVAVDDRIAPEANEQVIVKKRASAFHGTYLSSFLKANGVDTVILTGVTMAGCVRHTTEDAIAEGFRPIVVRECVGDRVRGVVEWNLLSTPSLATSSRSPASSNTWKASTRFPCAMRPSRRNLTLRRPYFVSRASS